MKLCQHFTPGWLAEALVERHFYRLGAGDAVVEPTCGEGAFLHALPAAVHAVGIEVDPVVAARARLSTGREIVVADVLDPVLTGFSGLSAVIGNPPFRTKFIMKLLERCHGWLRDGGQVGLILPCYAFRTAETVVELSERWSISQELLPRSAFAYRMREPLVFAMLTKDRLRNLVGFALFDEEVYRQGLAKAYRDVLSRTRGSAWRAVCRLALSRMKATVLAPASLQDIYRELERNRPSRTSWWREKIRQTLRQYPDFVAIADGVYALA